MTISPYADWLAVLRQARLGVEPAELHGSLTGLLCAGWAGSPRELLAALALESGDDGHGPALHDLLARAAGRISGRLRGSEPIDILLPAAALEVRANATVEWCRGFLGGLGLTGLVEDAARDATLAGVLANFGRIAAGPLACDEDDEPTLAGVHAFVRDGVAYLYRALAPARP